MTTTLADARMVPALLVRDMAETLEFYSRLGFTLRGCAPAPDSPTWAEVERGAVRLQFHSDPPQGTPASPVCSGTFYVYADDIPALAREFEDNVEFAWGPEVMHYGMLEFGIRDPNGYYLAFTQPAART
jgi:catechol 2,3-dioxygenase-like lactoylglutathione lyase family enzyme